jgi:hypothetical protein
MRVGREAKGQRAVCDLPPREVYGASKYTFTNGITYCDATTYAQVKLI